MPPYFCHLLLVLMPPLPGVDVAVMAPPPLALVAASNMWLDRVKVVEKYNRVRDNSFEFFAQCATILHH